MKKLTSLICSFLILIAMTVTVALAQGTTSRVTGVVQDKNGAAVAGATVTLANEGTGVSLTAQTSDSGTYTFDLIQVGTYSVTIEKQGFKKFVSSHNLANVNEPLTVSATLEVGTVSEVVQVTTTAEAVQTSTSGNVGSTVEQRTLESLPIVTTRGRNPLDLLNFQPGVVVGSNTGGGVSVHGSRDRAFNFRKPGNGFSSRGRVALQERSSQLFCMFVEVRNRSYAATRNPAGNRKSQSGNSAAKVVGETRS